MSLNFENLQTPEQAFYSRLNDVILGNFMKLITIKKLYNCLKYELPEVKVDEDIRMKAVHSIIRMLEISE